MYKRRTNGLYSACIVCTPIAMEHDASIQAFKRAVGLAGSQTAFAKATGASQQLISYLLKRKRPLSAKYVLKAEAAFGVPRHALRPDIYPTDPVSASDAPAVKPSGPVVASKADAAFYGKRP